MSRLLRLQAADEYHAAEGALWMSSRNRGPIAVVVKIHAQAPIARRYARAFEALPQLLAENRALRKANALLAKGRRAAPKPVAARSTSTRRARTLRRPRRSRA